MSDLSNVESKRHSAMVRPSARDRVKPSATILLVGMYLASMTASPTKGCGSTPPADESVDELVRPEMSKCRIPGLAVIQDGRIIKMTAYGMPNLEHDVPVTKDTVFELASLTKQFTATGIMRLMERGKLKLDDPIVPFLPDSPAAWKGITVRHLRTHTSGLAGMEIGFAGLWGGIDFSTAETYDAARKDPIDFLPGERFQYSDVGYFLLGMILEKSSGQRYREFLDEQFFKPLGMTSTTILDQSGILKHRAAGYTLRNGQLVNIRRVWQVELPSHYGVLSSVNDMAKWEIALAAGKVVQQSSLDQMWSLLKLNSGQTFPYGFAWGLEQLSSHRVITHTGITGTEYTRLLDDKLTVIMLTNLGLNVGDRDN